MFIALHLAKTKPSRKLKKFGLKPVLCQIFKTLLKKLDIAGLDVYLVELEML